MKNNIKKLREELGISQEQLANIVNIPVEELNDIESNKNIPSLLTARDITKALKKDFIADVFLFEE
ncbi:MAG: helix-turn-helix domain-containing protein [Methanobrevibacter sp.]|uniref:helix-turn-helix transcriptional regulator n=1 Tax=Methanobrevibacter sp. TaxID=66852 RepID=UPI001B0464D2|nr:helix-turn-helix domain-containing protein [Methanobrevibacter sp.]MBO6110779.1 helix-turn-helix domain-containing protein [Methanobrevibacter sp.]MBP3791559.1 helix-turn-helix domain-containing protein [Methanobrevibacter sp.]